VACLKSVLGLPGDNVEQVIHSSFGDCAKLIRTPEQFYALSELSRVLAFDTALDSQLRQALRQAHFTVTNDYYHSIVFAVPQSKPRKDYALLPVVTPIALEIDARLVPEDATPGLKQMRETGFPGMRDRILNEVGIRVPGVRIRSNEGNPEGGYFHSLNDTPLFLYTVYAGERFCPDAAKCQEAGLSGRVVDSPSPYGGKGMWLVEPDWHRAQAAGLPLWDAFEYMTVHTERIIREHLPLFFGVQELRNALDNWLEGHAPFATVSADQKVSRQALLARALPDATAQQRLLQVLQALLREQVPIKQLDAILTEFATASNAQLDVIEITERVRMALRADLLGNATTRTLIKLPQPLEQMIAEGIRRQNGKVFLALTPERTQEFLSKFRNEVDDRSEHTLTLVVSTSALRPFVKRVVELEFTTLPVLAETELALTQERDQQ
jgi:type III secretion protein V